MCKSTRNIWSSFIDTVTSDSRSNPHAEYHKQYQNSWKLMWWQGRQQSKVGNAAERRKHMAPVSKPGLFCILFLFIFCLQLAVINFLPVIFYFGCSVSEYPHHSAICNRWVFNFLYWLRRLIVQNLKPVTKIWWDDLKWMTFEIERGFWIPTDKIQTAGK